MQSKLEKIPDDVMLHHVLPHMNIESQKHLRNVTPRYNDLVTEYANLKRNGVLRKLLGESQPTFAELLYHLQMRAGTVIEPPTIPTNKLLKKITNILTTSGYSDNETLRKVLCAVYNKPATGSFYFEDMDEQVVLLHSDLPPAAGNFKLPAVGVLKYAKSNSTPYKIDVHCINEGPAFYEGQIGFITVNPANRALFDHKGWIDQTKVPELERALKAADITVTDFDPKLYNGGPYYACKKILYMALTRRHWLGAVYDPKTNPPVPIYDVCC